MDLRGEDVYYKIVDLFLYTHFVIKAVLFTQKNQKFSSISIIDLFIEYFIIKQF
jgi:hypothetical protein